MGGSDARNVAYRREGGENEENGSGKCEIEKNKSINSSLRHLIMAPWHQQWLEEKISGVRK